jgi:hypothetical protein
VNVWKLDLPSGLSETKCRLLSYHNLKKLKLVSKKSLNCVLCVSVCVCVCVLMCRLVCLLLCVCGYTGGHRASQNYPANRSEPFLAQSLIMTLECDDEFSSAKSKPGDKNWETFDIRKYSSKKLTPRCAREVFHSFLLALRTQSKIFRQGWQHHHHHTPHLGVAYTISSLRGVYDSMYVCQNQKLTLK